MPPLYRAFPLNKGHHVTFAIPKHLHLNVACTLDILLNENASISKIGLALPVESYSRLKPM